MQNTRFYILVDQNKHVILFFLLLLLLPGLVVSASLLSERTYKRLNQIYKLVDKEDFSNALGYLDKLMKQSGDREYDKAMIYQAYGYVYKEMNNPEKAIENYQAAISTKELPPGSEQNIRISLANLYYVIGDVKKALIKYEEWYKKQKSPSAEALVFGGSLYYENDEYDKAISFVYRAINSTSKPQESWYTRLAAIYLKKEDYENAANIFSRLVEINPTNKLYWKQLSASRYYSNNIQEALSVMLIAYEKELLTSEKELINLAMLATSQGIPIRASRILKKGIDSGIIEKNTENMEMLANICIQSREYQLAKDSLYYAAESSKDSKLYLKLANLYADNYQWDKALDLLSQHIPENPQYEAMWLLLKGISLYELGRMEESKEVFQQLSSNTKSSKVAIKWLDYLDTVKN